MAQRAMKQKQPGVRQFGSAAEPSNYRTLFVVDVLPNHRTAELPNVSLPLALHAVRYAQRLGD
jgi:hypothetical protein